MSSKIRKSISVVVSMFASAWVYSAIDEHIRPGQNCQHIADDNLKRILCELKYLNFPQNLIQFYFAGSSLQEVSIYSDIELGLNMWHAIIRINDDKFLLWHMASESHNVLILELPWDCPDLICHFDWSHPSTKVKRIDWKPDKLKVFHPKRELYQNELIFCMMKLQVLCDIVPKIQEFLPSRFFH